MNKQRLWVIVIYTLVIASLSSIGGCGRQRINSESQVALVWPSPPEVPRIRFVKTVHHPTDLDIHENIFVRFVNYLRGKKEISIVSPYGVNMDKEGRFYVVDTYLKQAHVFDLSDNSHHYFPGKGESLLSPIDIAIDDIRGRIYLSDSKKGIVYIYSKDKLEQRGEIKFSGISRPTGLSINSITKELLVVDSEKSKIFRIGLKDHNMKGIIGGEGAEEGMFHAPTHIFTTPDGRIYVSDSLNFRVQIFSPHGEFIRSIGVAGDSPGTFSRPKGVAVDSDGNIYVVDALFDNIQVFDKDGRLLLAFGGPGHDFGKFWLPSGIYIDKDDYIFISDTYNRRVQVFQYLTREVSLKR
jgi:DNA-binding beta-propeller fold protein YncE